MLVQALAEGARMCHDSPESREPGCVPMISPKPRELSYVPKIPQKKRHSERVERDLRFPPTLQGYVVVFENLHRNNTQPKNLIPGSKKKLKNSEALEAPGLNNQVGNHSQYKNPVKKTADFGLGSPIARTGFFPGWKAHDLETKDIASHCTCF